MKQIFLISSILLVGCGDSEIEPDPTSSTGTTNPTSSSSSTGAGGDGQGGGGQGGDGAGGGTMPGGGYESGSRLKVRTIVGSDGARQPAGWHDSELDVDCSFREDALGTQRCLPLAHFAYYYTDPACSIPVAYFPCGGPTYQHAEVKTNGCGTPVNIYQIGVSMTPPLELYVRAGNGTCTFAGAAQPGTYYALGAPIPPTTFVQASIEIEP